MASPKNIQVVKEKESDLDVHKDNVKCYSIGCSRLSTLTVQKCGHSICECCLSKMKAETEDRLSVFVCPLCIKTCGKFPVWVHPERLRKVCMSKKLCMQCFEVEALYGNSCGHIFCQRCICKLRTKTGEMICGVSACGEPIDPSNVEQCIKMSESILVWRCIKFPDGEKCTAMNNCTGLSILALRACKHSYCFDCTKNLKRNKNKDLIGEDYLICIRGKCETLMPKAVLNNYLKLLFDEPPLTAFTVELSFDACGTCNRIEDIRNPKLIHIRNKCCGHAFCIICIQKYQKYQNYVESCQVLKTDSEAIHMWCLKVGCYKSTPMKCLNFMMNIVLGKNPKGMVEVFLRRADIGEECDACNVCPGFVTRLVCSHTLCLQCTRIIVLSQDRYNQCKTGKPPCKNLIPKTIFEMVYPMDTESKCTDETSFTKHQEYVPNKYAEDKDSTTRSPENFRLRQETLSSIALVQVQIGYDNMCVFCAKTAIVQMVECSHKYCIDCLRDIEEAKGDIFNCTKEQCSSYVTKKSVEEFLEHPPSIDIQMPLHFGLSTAEECNEPLCKKRADFTIMACKHSFCIDCLQKCSEISKCRYKYCNEEMPSPEIFDNLFKALKNEKEHPFLLKSEDVEAAKYFPTAKTWSCSNSNCHNQAEFLIIRCGHAFCLNCGMQEQNHLTDNAELKKAICVSQECREVYPLPTSLQSNVAAKTSEKACFSSTVVGKAFENKAKNDKIQSGKNAEKRKEDSTIKAAAQKKFKPAQSRGLLNIGLSCYRNGILQILAETPDFLENLNTIQGEKDVNWISLLINVLKGIQKRNTMEEDNIDLLYAFHHHFNQSNRGFKEYQQDDTLSFLTSILNGIEDAHPEIKNIGAQKENAINPTDLFKGQLRDKYECEKCKHTEYFNESKFFSLPLPVDSDKMVVTIGSCLVQLLHKETVDLPCSKCDSHVVSKEIEIEVFPKILVLQICKVEEVVSTTRRRTIQKKYTKLRFWGDFKGLTTSELKRKNVANDLQLYRLFGVVVHWGSEYGGHYICYVKQKVDQKWYRCNDSSIVESSLNEVLGSDPYLLFYERFESQV